MKRFILGILVGALIVGAVIWYNSQHRQTKTEQAKEDVRNALAHTGDAIREKLDDWHLGPDDIKDELNKTGRVVREKAQAAGEAISDAATDTRITTTIKAKLVNDPGLATSRSVSVSTKDGVVTLSGTAESMEYIGKSIQTAMSVDGVRKVISTIQVKK
jgi:hypothetical protein